MFIFLIYFERVRERERERERERKWKWKHKQGRARERILSSVCADSTEPHVGLELTNCEIMTWVEIKSWTLFQLSHSAAPRLFKIFFKFIFICFFLFLFVFIVFICFERKQVGEGQKERERERFPSRLCAHRPEPRSRAWCSSGWATQAPLLFKMSCDCKT